MREIQCNDKQCSVKFYGQVRWELELIFGPCSSHTCSLFMLPKGEKKGGVEAYVSVLNISTYFHTLGKSSCESGACCLLMCFENWHLTHCIAPLDKRRERR